VLLSDDEIRAAYPKTMQTIGIERFVKAQEVSFTLLEKPYFLEPDGRADKVYALLREAMLAAGVIGIARIVLHTKEHLAALVAAGPALMLVTLRWANEIRSPDDLQLPPEGKSAASLKESELKMAQQLIGDMTEPWKPEEFTDRFTEAIHALVARKAAAGETEAVTPFEEAPAAESSNVVDLTELLKQSLRKGGKAAADAAPAKPSAKKAAAKGAAKKATAKKRA
jgi:DNA end-binding protein Ku